MPLYEVKSTSQLEADASVPWSAASCAATDAIESPDLIGEVDRIGLRLARIAGRIVTGERHQGALRSRTEEKALRMRFVAGATRVRTRAGAFKSRSGLTMNVVRSRPSDPAPPAVAMPVTSCWSRSTLGEWNKSRLCENSML